MDDERAKSANEGWHPRPGSETSAAEGWSCRAIRDSQTEVLNAFYGFTQTVQARFQEQDQT